MSTQTIARIDYITDGTPPNTIVVITLGDGTQLDISATVCRLEQEADSPVTKVTFIGTSPIRDHAVNVDVSRARPRRIHKPAGRSTNP